MPGKTRSDEYWMRMALRLAKKAEGDTRPNPPVGAVIVRSGIVVGKGFHRKAGGDHAEVIAIANAGKKAKQATLYVTLEPCCTQGRTPPCTDAIIRSGIKRVVVSAMDPNSKHNGNGLRILLANGLDVDKGICEKDGMELIAPFSKWILSSMPFVSLKMGMSLDGRISDSNCRSKWITSAASRRIVSNLRQSVDAILVGAHTASIDDPSLACLGKAGNNHFRVIVDSKGQISADAKLLNNGVTEKTIIATTTLCSVKQRLIYEAKGAQVWLLPKVKQGVSLNALMRKLAKAGVLHVLCEGGGVLAHSLIKADLVDKYLFFVAPKIIAGKTSSIVVDGAGWALPVAPNLKFTGVKRVGDDVLLTAIPLRQPK